MWSEITSQELAVLYDKLGRAADCWALVHEYQKDPRQPSYRESWAMYLEMSKASAYVWRMTSGRLP